MKKNILLGLLLAGSLAATGQNPVIRTQYAADPTARAFNGRVYLYPSHDIPVVPGHRADWFSMADYHVFSSDNLTDWQDHGVILSQEQVPWGNPDAYSMWAPDCVCKNGRYYFYFPDAPRQGQGFGIGVATADSPEGPFRPEAEPIKGVSGIDPCVLIDDDGQAYIYWSGMGIRGARLKANMTELDGELKEIKLPQRPGSDQKPMTMVVGGETMEGLPDGFKEGPHAFKRNGWYYLTFPWVRKENGTETLAYAMSRQPLGPWEFKGIFMEEHANGCWTNHHSFLEWQGEWYLFYHWNDFSPNDDKRRSARIDRVSFNADGTINLVRPTLRGVGINKATERIEVDCSGNAPERSFVDTLNYLSGYCATLPRKGSSLTYEGVDFSMLRNSPWGQPDAYVVVKAKAQANTAFTIRENSAKGRVIARVPVTVVQEMGRFRRDQSGQWLTLTVPVTYLPKGVASLALTCEGEGVSIDWLQFKNRKDYFRVPPTTTSPDEQGFLRRWTLLEPIEKPVRSNVVFTDTYLRDAFNQNYFKDQQTIVPRDGQKVKAGKQTLTWHSLESNTYNVRLFRFAETLGKQTYGVLFWGVCVIDCPEEMTGVRLAAGSNGASAWWLNGEEVLVLSGDRRMVQDDGLSARLTLKKGRNILRCAVINGPGLSDFCVRFLDENNQPVKNLNIR